MKVKADLAKKKERAFEAVQKEEFGAFADTSFFTLLVRPEIPMDCTSYRIRLIP
jgi:hypothetical protein